MIKILFILDTSPWYQGINPIDRTKVQQERIHNGFMG